MAAFSLELIPEDFSITSFEFNFSQKALNRGLTYFKEGYVHKIKVTKGPKDDIEISGRCFRSMRKAEQPHTLSLTVSATDNNHYVSDAYCSCTAGSGGTCSHMVGLVKTIQQLKLLGLKDAPAEQASTSLPQIWHIPRGNKINPVSVNEVVVTKAKEKRQKAPIIQKPLDYKRLPVITDEQASLLKKVEGAPISRLNLASRPVLSCDFGVVPLGSVLGYQSIIQELKRNKSESITCANTELPIETKVKLPPWHSDLRFNMVNSAEIEESTREQHKNPSWHQYRKTRVTASKMHRIILRKKKPTKALLQSIFSVTNFTCAATDYGICKEKVAKAKYVTEKSADNVHLHECGLIINNAFPFLAASPDAKVCDGDECGLLKVKCPYTARDMTLSEAVDNINNFLLFRENGIITINKSHDYYVQIQGQLLVTGAPWCDLAVYTSRDFFVERIFPNISFMTSMLCKLALFYKFYALPHLQ